MLHELLPFARNSLTRWIVFEDRASEEMAMTSALEALVELDRYPVTSLSSEAGRTLLAECRNQLTRRGVCLLDGFIREDAIKSMVSDVESLIPLCHHYASCTTTPYQETVSPDAQTNHPRRTPRTSSNHVLAYDLIPSHAGVRRLYESDALLDFIAAVLGLQSLHRYADRLGALNIAINMAGDHNGWHFDQCDFVTSLLIREAQSGGLFEFVPNIRTQKDENYSSVKRVLDGDRDRVVTLPMKAGSLSIFKGRQSMHRVTEIAGEKPRLIALLGYDTQPGVLMTESASRRRFGRVA